MVSIITVILVISFLVFVHELGHYLAARAVGVKVIEFSVGFPPKVFSKVIGQTEYMLSLIPIGGYVRLHGQNFDDENTSESDNYAAKSIWQRLVILLAGPLMNLIVAFVFMPFVFYIGYDIPAYMLNPPVIDSVISDSAAEKLDIRKNDLILSLDEQPVSNWRQVQNGFSQTQRETVSLTIRRDAKIIKRHFKVNLLKQKQGFGWNVAIPPVVGAVSSQSPAEQGGLLSGDRILKINGKQIEKWSEISPHIQENKENTLSLLVLRDSRTTRLQVKPEWNNSNSYWLIGIGSQTARVSEPFGQAIATGIQRVIDLGKRTFEFLYQLVTLNADKDSVGGPIMIAQMVGKAAQTDFSSLISLVAFISLQFAIFNLLPIPALDGGHIFFLGLEKLKGSALSKGFRLSSQKIGFTLLICLIIYISIQDGLRLFSQ